MALVPVKSDGDELFGEEEKDAFFNDNESAGVCFVPDRKKGWHTDT
jgi:hypothetical protein